jgi:hypothetical protein
LVILYLLLVEGGRIGLLERHVAWVSVVCASHHGFHHAAPSVDLHFLDLALTLR